MSIEGRTVLVVDESAKARRLTCRGIAATGARSLGAKDSDQAVEILKAEPVDLVVVGWQNADVVDRAVDVCSDKLEVVLLTNRPVFERHAHDIMVMPMSSMIVSSFVARAEEQDPIATRELVTTVAKLFTSDIFGLEKYLGWGAAICEHRLAASAEAEGIVAEASEYASGTGMSPKDIANLSLLIDELVTNAIWDAPVDEEGRPKYHKESRAVPIQLLDNETVSVRYGSDGNMFGVSVRDQFGRLDRELAVKYIRKCFREGDPQISSGPGGSGLGLYMAYNSVSSFVINVDPGKCTEVIGLIRLNRPRNPARENNSRSLCYFRTKTAGESDLSDA